ncbi:hypothetical protein THMIRHAS_06680 [Thiosulfatimonas sediminis]|uniref:Lipopolysaccharide export system protein LptA n=1 Tax=Thiosulfatimonas sediminis TaxID=2675054 RepID=A0A6F8PT52_9GAMM|nr:lipopolysaccharide transport periplasmic protein LptA [Thiosulfatimonas sediminis]BBP45295.1 hypothetical protein THMIRHAS_06680 [Thiosulfatimonas sediminis]
MTLALPFLSTVVINKLTLGTLLLCVLVFSLPAISAERNLEKNDAISIKADQLLVQEKQGISRYQGNVEVQQGALQLAGDQIEITHPNNQLQKIEISGNPATFERIDPQTKTLTKGQAKTIRYVSKTDTLTFIGDAQVAEDGKHKISGAKLVYDLQQQTLQAESDAQNKERVEVILIPNTQTP